MPFTYSGPSVAAAFVAGMFNDAEAAAAAARITSKDSFDDAHSAIANVPDALAAQPTAIPAQQAPTFDIAALLARQGELDAIGANRGDLLAGLVEDLEAFMAEFFPGVDEGVATARAGIVAMIEGANLADGWEVSRLRMDQTEEKLMRDLEDIEAGKADEFAAKGFRAPPGEMHYQVALARREKARSLADAAWDTDMQEGGREKEALERALRLLEDLRARAIAAFSAYMARAVIERFDRGLARTQAALEATQLASDMLYQQQQAINRAAALQLKAAETDHGLSRRFLVAIDQLAERQAQAVMEKFLALAKMLGAQAATAFNQMRAQAGISGSESMNDL